VAESELLSAANSIEAAARKLSQLQPRMEVSKVSSAWNRLLLALMVGHSVLVLAAVYFSYLYALHRQ